MKPILYGILSTGNCKKLVFLCRQFFFKFFIKINYKKVYCIFIRSKNSVKTWLYWCNHFFQNSFFELLLKSLAIFIYLGSYVVLVKNKKNNKKLVLGYTSLFVLVSSSFLSSLYLQRFTILQATLRRDYLRRAFFQLIIF